MPCAVLDLDLDLDLNLDLIIILHTEKSFVDRLAELYRTLAPRVALDLLAYTPEELKISSQNTLRPGPGPGSKRDQ